METLSTAPAVAPAARSHSLVPDVVAGLVNDGSAFAVARAAAREAAWSGARVRFVQVISPGASPQDREDADRETFRSALHALKGLRRVPCSFEVVEGDAAEVLVERSADASLLVVGKDVEDHDVARRCARLATCNVLTVAG